MVTRFVGAALGLFAFSVSVLAGLYAQNPVRVVLSRSILALFVFFLIGVVVGHLAQRVIADHFNAREAEVRQEPGLNADDSGNQIPNVVPSLSAPAAGGNDTGSIA